MLIIAGHIEVDPDGRDRYVDGCRRVVAAARAAPGCHDFSITADPVSPGHVRVYERWEDEPSLLAFRGSGPAPDQQAAFVSGSMARYGVASVGDP